MRPIYLPPVLILAAAPCPQNLVRDIAPPHIINDSNITAMVELHGLAVFGAVTAHGLELWRSDGTETGTSLLKDTTPGVNGSDPAQLTVAGKYVFFSAHVPGLGYEVWRTDGTSTLRWWAGRVARTSWPTMVREQATNSTSAMVHSPTRALSGLALSYLGRVVAAVGRLEEAESLLREACTRLMTVAPTSLPRKTIATLVALYRRQGKEAEAVVWEAKLDGQGGTDR